MSQFKVEFIRSGVKHKPSYVRSIEAAIRKAQSKGWYGDEGGGCWDGCPTKVNIHQEVDGIYELVAVVERKKITAIKSIDRHSVYVATKRIEREQQAIKEAELLMATIQQIELSDKANMKAREE